eukprot:jgi/Picsp_1/314/NSC_00313-R1_---NA---
MRLKAFITDKYARRKYCDGERPPLTIETYTKGVEKREEKCEAPDLLGLVDASGNVSRCEAEAVGQAGSESIWEDIEWVTTNENCRGKEEATIKTEEGISQQQQLVHEIFSLDISGDAENGKVVIEAHAAGSEQKEYAAEQLGNGSEQATRDGQSDWHVGAGQATGQVAMRPTTGTNRRGKMKLSNDDILAIFDK